MPEVQFTDQNRFTKRRGGRKSSVHDAHEDQLAKLFQSSFREQSGYKMEGMLHMRQVNRGWDFFNTGLTFLNPEGPKEEWVERHVMLSLDAIDHFPYADEEDKHNVFFTDVERVHHRESRLEQTDHYLRAGSFRNKLLMDQALSASSVALSHRAQNVELGPNDFIVLTCSDGFHRGEPVVFRAASHFDRDLWVASITQILLTRRDYELHPEPVAELQRWRRIVRRYYMNQKSQLLVAFLISFNFMVNVVDHQNNSPDHEPGQGAFEQLDLAFTCIFVIELSVNLFSTLVWEFLSDGWNYFDFLVVLVSIMSLAAPNIPGGATLKLTRTFRVFRLFKRIKSMRRIMASLIHALPAMANAYVLLTLLTAIYAILCVNFFRTVNEERFGNFFSSMFTLWQIMTGDDWSVLVRELFEGSAERIGIAIFFVSFQLLVTFTMVNVVVCVLLEGFSSSIPNDGTVAKSFHGSKSVEEWHRHCMLFPLCRQLSRCRDAEHLHGTIDNVFRMLFSALPEESEKRQLRPEDVRLSFEEVRGGLMEVPLHPPALMQREQWERFVAKAGLEDAEGCIGAAEFERLVKVALKQYQLHGAEKALETSNLVDTRTVGRTLTALKGRMFEVDERKREEERLALAKARWGEAYETGDVVRGGWGGARGEWGGGWGPEEGEEDAEAAGGGRRGGRGSVDLLRKLTREMKAMERHVAAMEGRAGAAGEHRGGWGARGGERKAEGSRRGLEGNGEGEREAQRDSGQSWGRKGKGNLKGEGKARTRGEAAAERSARDLLLDKAIADSRRDEGRGASGKAGGLTLV